MREAAGARNAFVPASQVAQTDRRQHLRETSDELE